MSHNEINLESMNLKRALETLCSSASKQLFAQAEDDLIRTQRAPGLLKMFVENVKTFEEKML